MRRKACGSTLTERLLCGYEYWENMWASTIIEKCVSVASDVDFRFPQKIPILKATKKGNTKVYFFKLISSTAVLFRLRVRLKQPLVFFILATLKK